MDMNKKGIMFTLIALLLAGLFITLFSIKIHTPIDAKQPIIESKINVIKSYSENLESYTEDMLSIASRDALRGVLDFVYNYQFPARNEKDVGCMLETMISKGDINTSIEDFDSKKRNFTLCLEAKTDTGAILFETEDFLDPSCRGAGSDPNHAYCCWVDKPAAGAPDEEGDDPAYGTSCEQWGRGWIGLDKRYFVWEDFQVRNDGLLRTLIFRHWDQQLQEKPWVNITIFVDIYEGPYAPSCKARNPVASSTVIYETWNCLCPPITTRQADFDSSYVFKKGEIYHIRFYSNSGHNMTILGVNRTGTNPPPYDAGFSATRNAPSDLIYYVHPHIHNKTLSFWLERLGNFSKDELRVYTSWELEGFTLEQKYPWELDIGLDISFNIVSEEAMLSTTHHLESILPLEGMYDPLFFFQEIETGTTRKYNKTIKRTPYVYDTDFDIETFSDFYMNEHYKENKNGSSFIMRMMNITQNGSQGSKCCGIESTIGPNQVIQLKTGQPLPNYEDVSYMDYLYFYALQTGDRWGCNRSYHINDTAASTVPGIATDWSGNDQPFQLDVYHLIELNIKNEYWLARIPQCVPP